MNFDRYIISFKPGSSGRFIKFILVSMLTDFKGVIQLSDVNDTHMNDAPQGVIVSAENMHKSSIYTTEIFDHYSEIKVLATHAYPDIEAIKNMLGKPGIILITVDSDDMPEVEMNHLIKNNSIDVLNPKVNLTYFKTSIFSKPIESDIVLILKYSDIFKPTLDSYVGLEKLEKFAGIKASENVKMNYKKYVEGQEILVEKHRAILNEITSFFDKY